MTSWCTVCVEVSSQTCKVVEASFVPKVIYGKDLSDRVITKNNVKLLHGLESTLS